MVIICWEQRVHSDLSIRNWVFFTRFFTYGNGEQKLFWPGLRHLNKTHQQLKHKKFHCSKQQPLKETFLWCNTMHVERRMTCKSLQINSAPCPWATAVQVSEERSKGRNRSERTVWILTTVFPSVGLLDIVCVLTECGLCTGSDCRQSDRVPYAVKSASLCRQCCLCIHLIISSGGHCTLVLSPLQPTNHCPGASASQKTPCGWVVALKIVQVTCWWYSLEVCKSAVCSLHKRWCFSCSAPATLFSLYNSSLISTLLKFLLLENVFAFSYVDCGFLQHRYYLLTIFPRLCYNCLL